MVVLVVPLQVLNPGRGFFGLPPRSVGRCACVVVLSKRWRVVAQGSSLRAGAGVSGASSGERTRRSGVSR